jgi:hypothetical protein
VALDSAGNVFFAADSMVLEVPVSTGNLTVVAGCTGTSYEDPCGNCGPFDALCEALSPGDVATVSSGNVYSGGEVVNLSYNYEMIVGRYSLPRSLPGRWRRRCG